MVALGNCKSCYAWNHLVEVWEDEGDGGFDGDDSKVALYRYDGLNRRIAKMVVTALDLETLCTSVSKTGRAFVISQAPKRCSFAEHVVSEITENSFANLKAPVRVIAAAAVPPPMSPVLEQASMPTAEKACEIIIGTMSH